MNVFSHARARRLLHALPAELSAPEQKDLANHLAGCQDCRNYAGELQTLQPALRRAMHTRWDSRRPSSTSSGAVQQRWKEKKMKQQAVRLTALVACLGAVVVLFIYGPGLLSALISLFNFGPGTSQVEVVPLVVTPTVTYTQSAPDATQTTPEPLEINELSSFLAHDNQVWGLDLSSDGKWLATSSMDGTAKIWDLSNNQELLALNGEAGIADTVAFSPDGAILAVSYEDGVTILWDTTTGEALRTLPGDSWATSLEFSPDGTQLAVSYYDSIAQVWDVQSGQVSLTLSGHTSVVDDVDFSPDGERLLTASGDGTAKIWDLATGKELITFKGLVSGLFSGAFSPDGASVVAFSRNTKGRVWDATSGELLVELDAQGEVWDVEYSPDGKFLATTGMTPTPVIWDAASGKLLMKLVGHKSFVAKVEFSLDGQTLITVGDDGTVRFWDVTP